MKIVLYIDRIKCFESTFYTKELLYNSFKKKGHNLEIHIVRAFIKACYRTHGLGRLLGTKASVC